MSCLYLKNFVGAKKVRFALQNIQTGEEAILLISDLEGLLAQNSLGQYERAL